MIQSIKRRIHALYEERISPNLGVSLLLLSQFLNSIMILTCKLLEADPDFSEPIQPTQILLARMFITYVCCVAYMLITKSVDDAPFGPPNIRALLILRGVTGFFGVFGMYYSLQYLSLSDAVSITFLIPMFTAFIAWILLREKYSVLEAVCSLLSLVGILLVAKPDFLFGGRAEAELPEGDSAESSSSRLRILATIMGLVGVCGASSVYVVLRKIGKSAHPLLSVSYFALTTFVVCLVATIVIPSVTFQIPTTFRQWFLFSLIGFSGFFMQFCLAAGLQREKAGKSSMMIYINMVFALIWDFVFWGHFPGILSLLGICLIITNAYIIIKYRPATEENSKPTDIETVTKYDVPDDIDLDFIISDDESDRSKSPDRRD